MGPAIAQNPYHIPIVRQQLTRNLAALFPSVREELAQAFRDNIHIDGDGTERLIFMLWPLNRSSVSALGLAVWAAIAWVSVGPTLKTMMQIVCRTSNRVFVGLPLCELHRSPELLAKTGLSLIAL